MADAPLWLQVLGPVATIGASFVAGIIAVRLGRAQVRINDAQREIAASQRDIAKRRVQMDLHNKRYEILRAARELMELALKSPPDKVKMQELRRTLSQAPFFFPAHIAKVAGEISTACVDASTPSETNNPSAETIDRKRKASIKVAGFIDHWPAPFSEVMTFRDVE